VSVLGYVQTAAVVSLKACLKNANTVFKAALG